MGLSRSRTLHEHAMVLGRLKSHGDVGMSKSTISWWAFGVHAWMQATEVLLSIPMT